MRANGSGQKDTILLCALISFLALASFSIICNAVCAPDAFSLHIFFFSSVIVFTFSLLLLFFNPSSSSVHTLSLSFHICAVVYAIAIAASFLCVSKFLSSFFSFHMFFFIMCFILNSLADNAKQHSEF